MINKPNVSLSFHVAQGPDQQTTPRRKGSLPQVLSVQAKKGEAHSFLGWVPGPAKNSLREYPLYTVVPAINPFVFSFTLSEPVLVKALHISPKENIIIVLLCPWHKKQKFFYCLLTVLLLQIHSKVSYQTIFSLVLKKNMFLLTVQNQPHSPSWCTEVTEQTLTCSRFFGHQDCPGPKG